MSTTLKYDFPGLSIKEENMGKCLSAINALHSDRELLISARGRGICTPETPIRSYCWYTQVRNPAPGGFRGLEEAFVAWGFCNEGASAVVDGSFYLSSYEYTSVMGQQKILLSAIAPFVEGVVNIYCDADGEAFTWHFENGQISTRHGVTDPQKIATRVTNPKKTATADMEECIDNVFVGKDVMIVGSDARFEVFIWVKGDWRKMSNTYAYLSEAMDVVKAYAE